MPLVRTLPMAAWRADLNRIAATGLALVLAMALVRPGTAAERARSEPEQDQDQAETAQAEAAKAEYSKEFRKLGGPVQELVNEKKWPEVMAALPELEAIPNATRDDRKAIATWKLQATQGVGDQDAFAAAIEAYLAEGFAEGENVGVMHRQLAAHYSGKKDNAKTLEHFQKFVDSTSDVQPDEYETLGRLHMQSSHYPEACQYLGKAI